MNEQVSTREVRSAVAAAQAAKERKQKSFTYASPVLTAVGTNFDFSKAKVRQVDLGPLIDAIQNQGWHLEGLDYSTINGPEREAIGIKSVSSQIQAMMFFTRG